MNIEEQVKKSIPLFRNVQDILLLGRGFGYAVANETELKIMEASYTNAKAYSSCDYPHGPIATTKRFITCNILFDWRKKQMIVQ